MIFSYPENAAISLCEEWNKNNGYPYMGMTLSSDDIGSLDSPALAVTEIGSSGAGNVVSQRNVVFDFCTKEDTGWQKLHTDKIRELTVWLSNLPSDMSNRITWTSVSPPRVDRTTGIVITTLPAEIIFNEERLSDT